MMIWTSSSQAAQYVAANLPGPGVRSLCQHCALADSQSGGQQTIISKYAWQMHDDICERVSANYTIGTQVAFSLSIDATANGSMLLVNKTRMILVGGAYPDHCISIPEVTRVSK